MLTVSHAHDSCVRNPVDSDVAPHDLVDGRTGLLIYSQYPALRLVRYFSFSGQSNHCLRVPHIGVISGRWRY